MTQLPPSSLNILVIAYECSPRRGSESGAGFSLVRAVAEEHNCTVLVGRQDGATLAEWAGASNDRVKVREVREGALGWKLFEIGRYPRFLAYLIWLLKVGRIVRREADQFDVVWHVTYSPFWLPTPLRFVKGAATVWGPVTGGDRTPRALRAGLGWRARLTEALDTYGTRVFSLWPPTRRSLRQVDLVLTSLDRPEIRRRRSGPVWSFPQSLLASVADAPEPTALTDDFYFVSPLRSPKAPYLALEAVALDERLRMVVAAPAGGERDRFLADIERLGVGDRVTMVDGLSRNEMMGRLRGGRAFMHPATNDSSSMALSEALALGVPIVGIDVLGTRSVCQQADDRRYTRLVPVGRASKVAAALKDEMLALLDMPRPQQPLIDQQQLGARLRAAMRAAITSDAEPPRKIVQVFYQVQDRGGEAVAGLLARGLRERGHEVVNLGAFRTAPATSTTRDFKIFSERPLGNRGRVRLLWWLWRELRKLRPDAVFCHGDGAQLLGASTAFLAGVRTRVGINHLALGIYVKWLRPLHLTMAALGIYTDAVYVGASAMKGTDALPAFLKRRARLINNAVAVMPGDRASARAAWAISKDAFVFVNVGGLYEQKNQRVIIEALRRVPDAYLVIAGAGELADELNRLAADLGDRVRLIGRVDAERMGDVLALADAFVFPSRYEGRPLALIEAASAGLPIIASPIAENREVTKDAVAYAGVDDVDAWAAAMRRMVDDSNFREDLRRRVKDLDVGSPADMVDAYLRLIR